jgi:L-ascorbate 6-phosphate lactonase
MIRSAQEIERTRVEPGSLALWWLGQAGFAFKTPGGRVMYIDPYLSDAVQRLAGFKRLSLPAVDREEVRADVVVLTHEHEDHLDPDTIPVIARNNPGCLFAAPSGCAEGLDRAGVAPGQRRLLSPGARCAALPDVTVHAAAADHGSFSPSAVSVVLDLAGVKVMFTGDTSWRPDLFAPLYALGLDVLIPCINGGFGNMGHLDAARCAAEAGAPIAIPCHFWTFAEQGPGDPLGFVAACRMLAPGVTGLLLSPGETLTVTPRAGASS